MSSKKYGLIGQIAGKESYVVEGLAPCEAAVISRKRGRPSTGFNKTAYMKEYMRKRRAASKAKPLQEE